MSNSEIDQLIQKAKTIGLDYDEKAKLHLLMRYGYAASKKNTMPCSCKVLGENCQLHGTAYVDYSDDGYDEMNQSCKPIVRVDEV